ncbi:MAG: hypoxanthine phosphoribosyltransferase [Ignavibacteriales bacterium]|nr:MAG: hypoxanthine phosphoribosyltransferase [Ignavibacteriaceae bacterium]MBW7871915.1 hypoxanthine phosphoribosyltransferase [Ignavibacteria bacterium]MCZ2144235.1 hypoxanthine phosphoribosyltransferase [Ignavibacteriales bacterium]OQY79742.1 MAG: hypoxanthine phosphoribosyltransferase [Ignavibacteriales bacterium UTCHB3]MBV6446188.1 Hypoxanthine phosphoribosyltransferase [Ignavibacteriaceae bacterium]
MDKITVNGETFEIFITEEVLQKRIAELGAKISEDYKGKVPIFIGILNGAFMFLADLMKNFNGECEVDFLKLSSYHEAKVSSGKVDLLKDIDADLNQRHIVIVEDIIDSGLSAEYILTHIQKYNPASVKIASLLVKPKSLKYNIDVDYIGFRIPNNFVIGYGLDLVQKYRNLTAVYSMVDGNGN